MHLGFEGQICWDVFNVGRVGILPMIFSWPNTNTRSFTEATPKKTDRILSIGRIWLVVEPTHLKNMRVKLDIFPKIFGVKIRQNI